MSAPVLADPVLSEKSDPAILEKGSASYSSDPDRVVEDDVFGKISDNSVNYRDASVFWPSLPFTLTLRYRLDGSARQ